MPSQGFTAGNNHEVGSILPTMVRAFPILVVLLAVPTGCGLDASMTLAVELPDQAARDLVASVALVVYDVTDASPLPGETLCDAFLDDRAPSELAWEAEIAVAGDEMNDVAFTTGPK